MLYSAAASKAGSLDATRAKPRLRHNRPPYASVLCLGVRYATEAHVSDLMRVAVIHARSGPDPDYPSQDYIF